MPGGNTVTSAFVDLATYDELEKYMYGGGDAITYFVKETKKCSWFTQVPIKLSKTGGQGQFGQSFEAKITRAADYMMYNWLKVTFSSVELKNTQAKAEVGDVTATNVPVPAAGATSVAATLNSLADKEKILYTGTALATAGASAPIVPALAAGATRGTNLVGTAGNLGYANNLRLRWTRNLAHNLVSEIQLTFNDLTSWRCDNYHLDFWAAFTVPSSKRTGYDNMVGNVAEINNPSRSGAAEFPHSSGNKGTTSRGQAIDGFTLNLPIPHCHSLDSGVALPTAALPYNEMKLHFEFRDWTKLLIVDNIGAFPIKNLAAGASRPANADDLMKPPTLSDVEVWANYAVVSNTERLAMGSSPRDIQIQQVQTVKPQPWKGDNPTPVTLNLSHAVKTLFWGIRNNTNEAEWSNYTASSPDAFNTSNVDSNTTSQGTPLNSTNLDHNNGTGVQFSTDLGSDPIETTTLQYDSTTRLDAVKSDYFTLIQPWYHAKAIPEETGYHMYSYALDLMSSDSGGSTNFGKLSNVTMSFESSADAQTSAKAPPDTYIVNPTGITADTNINTYYDGLLEATKKGHLKEQTFRFVLTAINHNIIRISGGALGFPVL